MTNLFKIKSFYLFFCILFISLNGCMNKRPPYQAQAPHHAEVQLAEAANTISNSLVQLAKIQAAATPPAPGKKLVNPNSWGMQGIASIDWSGPIAPIVKHIAKASGYKVRLMGQEPTVPIIITLNTKDIPLATILRDVHYQANNKADIRVSKKHKVIELRYAAS